MEEHGNKTVEQALSKPAQFLPGVGGQRVKLLARLGLHTAADILFYFPRDYEDLSRLCRVGELVEGQPASVVGRVEEVDCRVAATGRTVVAVLLCDGTDYLRALWFNQPYWRDRFHVGDRLLLAGVPRQRGFRWEMTHPRVEVLSRDANPATGRILPKYGLTEGLQQSQMRRIAAHVCQEFSSHIKEALPEEIRRRRQLCTIDEALREIHLPSSTPTLQEARKRLIYQELLVMQLALALRRAKLQQQQSAPSLETTAQIHARITRRFPFELTADQQRAVSEIAADMARPIPMNRLLHGDVGTGKTVVAEYAMLLAVAHGYQAVLMAPTEILAVQHEQHLTRDLRQSRVRIGLLTGSLTPAARRQLLTDVAEGRIDLLVGTHAVIQSDVQFARLGLVVIDEQHRFGVRQRAGLREAGCTPHYLVMSATPIPRTVAMTLFGDLDVSELRSSPPGRQAVHTYLAQDELRERWWTFFARHLREGRQGYVVTPLIDPSDDDALTSVEDAFENLANGPLEEFRLDLLHGRMKAEEKRAVMERFRSGQTQVLVATSLIEVGIDVPNATIMTIESAERFGLAQLHQLRGRVSRGRHPGYVCLFASHPDNKALRRLQAFCRVQDGFELAELDMQLRGPGQLFGLQQHGFPPFRIADLSRDGELVQWARDDALELIKDDPSLASPQCARLRELVFHRYGSVLDLGDVG